jgi:hypothetical protein
VALVDRARGCPNALRKMSDVILITVLQKQYPDLWSLGVVGVQEQA